MHVVIVGCGRVGSSLAHNLIGEGHTVAIIDRKPAAFERLGGDFTGQQLIGIGFDRDLLVKAGIERAEALAAVTNGDKDRMARIEDKFGNDPDFVWLTAQIGKELQEDTSVQGGLTVGEQQTLESLMASPAYMDGKHADHARVVAQVQTLYSKRYAGR